jgi:hypothetical protein
MVLQLFIIYGSFRHFYVAMLCHQTTFSSKVTKSLHLQKLLLKKYFFLIAETILEETKQ